MIEFSLNELIGCLGKKRKARKRRRDSGQAKTEKAGTIVVGNEPTFLESVTKGVPRLSTTKSKAGDLFREILPRCTL